MGEWDTLSDFDAYGEGDWFVVRLGDHKVNLRPADVAALVAKGAQWLGNMVEGGN